MFGSIGRCFVGELQRNGTFQTKKLKMSSNGSFCFSSKCLRTPKELNPENGKTVNESAKVEISVFGKQFYCTAKGEKLEISVKTGDENSEITGFITCPDPEDFCLHEPKCRADCEILGRCLHNGNCYKFD